MNATDLVLLLIVIGIIIIIIISSRSSSSGKKLRKGSQLERRGQFLEALDYYAKVSLDQAIKLVLRIPEASQILALRRLEKKFHPRTIEQAFIRLARTLINNNDINAAAMAYILANKPFAASKVFIDNGGLEYVPRSVQIIDQYPSLIHDRNQAIRNLARHAYNTRKFQEAAELLRTIGANEEANTVLIAATTEMRKQGMDKEAENYISRAGQPNIAVQHYLEEVKKELNDGNIEKMRRSLNYARNITEKLSNVKKNNDESLNDLISQVNEYDRHLKTLDSARDILRRHQTNQAVALYDELLEGLGSDVPASILAEAALANEKENPRMAAELYRQASGKASSSRAAQSFNLRAKKLEILLETPTKSQQIIVENIEADVQESCIVCRAIINNRESLVRCPECGSPAHYAHLAEWLKIRGVCPICKKRVKLNRPEKLRF
ncbi:hypothetical protein [Candidatus Hodarchaeum mangrovi]